MPKGFASRADDLSWASERTLKDSCFLRNLRARRLAAGLCEFGCKTKLVTKTLCKKHRDAKRASNASLSARRKAGTAPPRKSMKQCRGKGCFAWPPKGELSCRECSTRKRERRTEIHLKYNYGMDSGSFRLLMKKQRGLCGICGRKFDIRGKRSLRPHLDHDHETGKARGLLCTGCNWSLPRNKKKAALSYLSRASG